MPCPRCHSNDLWDDLMWWGCNKCGWSNGGSVVNQLSSNDRFNNQPLSHSGTGNSCRGCGQPVPAKNANQSYCSEPCRRKGWRDHHPNEEEPDWDRLPISI